MVAGALGQDITGVTAAPQTGSTGSKLGPAPTPSANAVSRQESSPPRSFSPHRSRPPSSRPSKASAASGVTITSVPGLGNQNWIVEQGNGLSVLEGTMDIVIEAPATTDAQLEALARQIL